MDKSDNLQKALEKRINLLLQQLSTAIDTQWEVNRTTLSEKEWVSKSIPRAHLYPADIFSAIREKEEYEIKLKYQLEISRKLQLEINSIKERVQLINSRNNQTILLALYDAEAKLKIQLLQLQIALSFNKALMQHQSQQFNDALTSVNQSIILLSCLFEFLFKHRNVYPPDPEKLMNLASAVFNAKGLVCRIRGELEESFRNFTIAIMLNDKDGYAYSNRGFLLTLEMKLNERAIVDHHAANQLQRDDASIINGLGDVYWELASDMVNKRFRVSLMKKYFKENNVLKNDHENYFDFNWEERIALLKKSYIYYSRALQLSPDNPIFLENRAMLSIEKGDADSAINDLTKAIKVRPKYGRAYYYRGYIKAMKKDYDGAIEDFENANLNLVDVPLETEVIDIAIRTCRQHKERSLEVSAIKFTLTQSQSDIDYHRLNQVELLKHALIRSNSELKKMTLQQEEQINVPLYLEVPRVRRINKMMQIDCLPHLLEWIKNNKHKFKNYNIIDSIIKKSEDRNLSGDELSGIVDDIFEAVLKENDLTLINEYQEFYRECAKQIHEKTIGALLKHPIHESEKCLIDNLKKLIQNACTVAHFEPDKISEGLLERQATEGKPRSVILAINTINFPSVEISRNCAPFISADQINTVQINNVSTVPTRSNTSGDKQLQLNVHHFSHFSASMEDSTMRPATSLSLQSLKYRSDKRPTDYEYALLSDAVYSDNGGNLPPGWEIYTNGIRRDTQSWLGYFTVRSGYFGALYVNRAKGQLVLAHRGTLMNNPASLRADLEGIVKNQIISQQWVMCSFIQEAVAIANREGLHLSSTGHSLGAWLAELTVYLCHVRYQYKSINAVTFESPGVLPAIELLSSGNRTGNLVDLNELDIVIYFSYPNRINTCNPHIGTFFYMQPKDSYSNHTWLNHDLAAHPIAGLIKLFIPPNYFPRCIPMRNWPTGDELKQFFKEGNSNNDYLPRIEQLKDEAQFRLIFQAHFFPDNSWELNKKIYLKHFSDEMRNFLKGFWKKYQVLLPTHRQELEEHLGKLGCSKKVIELMLGYNLDSENKSLTLSSSCPVQSITVFRNELADELQRMDSHAFYRISNENISATSEIEKMREALEKLIKEKHGKNVMPIMGSLVHAEGKIKVKINQHYTGGRMFLPQGAPVPEGVTSLSPSFWSSQSSVPNRPLVTSASEVEVDVNQLVGYFDLVVQESTQTRAEEDKKDEKMTLVQTQTISLV